MIHRKVRFSWLSALFCVLLGLIALPAHAASWPSYEMPIERTTYQAAVHSIQYLLRVRGYRVAADGHFGEQTQNVVLKFQRSRGLQEDGVVGSQTWPHLIMRVQKGNRGDAVRAVQVLLQDLGSSVGVDGVFGTQTQVAVRKFQRAYRLRVDGAVGPATWRQLIQASHDAQGDEGADQ